MGSSGDDVLLSPAARKVFPFSIEAKNTKTFPSLAALRQSKFNEKQNTLACVIWKPPGKALEESLIYFNFKDFTEFWEKDINNAKTRE
jgi:hypothetical protein